MKKVPLFCCNEYSVDDLGNVYSKFGKILKSSVNFRGYLIINIMVNGKRKGLSVHRAILESFSKPPFKNAQVNHIDGNKQNNNLNNLEWCTAKENTQHSLYVLNNISNRGRSIIAISSKGWTKKFRSLRECARYLNCSHGAISAVINGYKKRCKGCTFKWADGEMENA